MSKNQFVLFVSVVALYVDQYNELYKLNSELDTRTLELHSKDAQLEAKKLECDLNRQSLEAEVEHLYRNLSEVRQLNSRLSIYNEQVEKEKSELQRSQERDRQELFTVKHELSDANEQIDKLRLENSEAHRRIREMEYQIEKFNDIRDKCTFICDPFQAFVFCTRAIVNTVKTIVTKGTSFLITAAEYFIDLLESKINYLQIE